MRRPPIAVLLLLGLCGVLLVIFGMLLFSSPAKQDRTASPPPPSRTSPEVTVADPARGSTAPGAPTVVVFGDYTCTHCRDLEADMTEILQRRPDVRLVWKNVPLTTTQAQAAAEAALCAGRQGQYFAYHDSLFSRDITADPSLYDDIAVELDLNLGAFQSCRENHTTAPLVRRTLEEAYGLGLSGVPAVYINGSRLEGAITADRILLALPSR